MTAALLARAQILLAVVHLGSDAAAGTDGESTAADNLTGESAWRGTNVAAFAGAFTQGLWRCVA